MKLSYALLAIAAATETTVASVETTVVATTGAAAETTAAAAAETTAAAAAAAETTAAAAAEITAAVAVETTAASTVEDTVALEACKTAQESLAATTNSLEKVAQTAACELACADIENESCGFLVNGLSFVLFAILAVFKY